ncbi:Cro repressor protein [Mannheimia varigena USDA-ARS-USMARC-1296]|uniref:Cro repressor protein n=1 Tax=Mannheimia varigena USDA-ARS-USMARC-1296 TaxID=1433287 RepID=W0QAU6_9PAST|nr:helix-turn-helix transcriptional regulator [Mannheimia varigena]AHG75407.1 Cro repressor protein [Mannheimia varigena USDA-ARS-USMARC-1296]
MNKIADFRKELNVTQAQLAEKIGWTQPRIANYETGLRTPSLQDGRKIVRALNAFGLSVSFDDVFPDDKQ